MKYGAVRRSTPVRVGAMALALGSAATFAAPQDQPNEFDVFVADQLTYDDNLFRLSDEGSVSIAPPNAEGRREDYVNRATAGVEGFWAISEQSFSIDARVDDNRFRYNDDLDHVSGRGNLNWDWRLGRRWSGKLGGDYVRALADFASSRLLIKDIVERSTGYFEGDLMIGSSWHFTGGARVADIEHSAIERRFDNAEITTYTGGIEYHTSLENVFGWEYRRTESDSVAIPTSTGQLDRSYIEDAGVFITQYALTDKTHLSGRAGYLDRQYPDALATDEAAREGFSGGIWDVSLNWQPSIKTGFTFSGWRSLRAYFDAESDYFVATGGSIGAKWAPTSKFGANLQVLREQQEYLSSSVNLTAAGPRDDRVNAAELLLTYRPRRYLEFDLLCRFEERESERTRLNYDGTRARLGLRIIL